MRFGRIATLLALAAAATCALAGGCTRPTEIVTSVWPVATSEATMAPPAGVGRYPLTGLQAADSAVVPAVPVCVKVHDDGSTSPFGVGVADVVYETADSGSGTQLACLYSSSDAPKVGPLGQSGMPDLWIVPQYRAMLFSAGATASIAASMKSWPGRSNGSADVGAPFSPAYGSRNGGYVRGPVALGLAVQFSASVTSSTAAHLRFSASSGSTATPISAVTIPFVAGRTVEWRWDHASGKYVRRVNGKARYDSATGKRISARNVVVIWARYAVLDPDLAGGGGFDVTLGGSGQVSVFRNGQRLDGRWKADGSSPPHFTAEDGSAIALSPGNTWFEAIPLSANITLR